MDTVLKILITLSIITAIVLVLALAWLFIKLKKSKADAKELLRSGKRDGRFTYRLLNIFYSRKNLIFHPSFLVKGMDGAARRISTELILVDRGGVFVINSINACGIIELQAQSGDFTVTNEQGAALIPNPSLQNKAVIKEIASIFRSAGIYNVPFHNITVFTGKRVSFKRRSSGFYTAGSLIDSISDLNRNRFLGSREIDSVMLSIRKRLYRKPASSNTQSR